MMLLLDAVDKRTTLLLDSICRKGRDMFSLNMIVHHVTSWTPLLSDLMHGESSKNSNIAFKSSLIYSLITWGEQEFHWFLIKIL